MRLVKIKNGIGFCAKKGCKHLMRESFQLVGKDPNGNVKVKKRFCLCEECSFEFMSELEKNVEVFN